MNTFVLVLMLWSPPHGFSTSIEKVNSIEDCDNAGREWVENMTEYMHEGSVWLESLVFRSDYRCYESKYMGSDGDE